jgi:D-alanyl-D-alanine carboxypeptidase (penicillin-binding protein 5/6)
MEPRIIAPLSKGQGVGNVIVSLGDAEIGRVPLVALEEVPTGGFWRRLIDTILLWFR